MFDWPRAFVPKFVCGVGEYFIMGKVMLSYCQLQCVSLECMKVGPFGHIHATWICCR